MFNKKINKKRGVTLIEILLVLVVVGMILFMFIGYYQQQALQNRIDKTAQQMQQILNAGLAYFVANGNWPATSGNSSDLTCLFGGGDGNCKIAYLLPTPGSTTMNSSFGNPFHMTSNSGNTCGDVSGNQFCSLFFVYTKIDMGTQSAVIANIIAGKLPLSYTSTSGGDSGVAPPTGNSCTTGEATSCYVVSAVNIPGQNLNNATAVNFAGVYHHNGCVPVPSCPAAGFKPEIVVAPVSVSGLSPSGGSNGKVSKPHPKVYPISSFTARATAMSKDPDACDNQSGAPPCPKNGDQQYWRVCLQVITESGDISDNGLSDWGNYVTLLAMTRCSIKGEFSGTSYTSGTGIYTSNN